MGVSIELRWQFSEHFLFRTLENSSTCMKFLVIHYPKNKLVKKITDELPILLPSQEKF